MIEHGHLGVVGDRQGGRRRTNRYRLILKTPKGGTPVPGFVQERRKDRAGKAEQFCTKGGTGIPPNLPSEPTQEPSATDLVKMDAKIWLSKTIPRGGRSWRVFAYECFKRAPDKTLDVSIQAERFSEFNVGKVMSDRDWWALWERWCRCAVDYARQLHR